MTTHTNTPYRTIYNRAGQAIGQHSGAATEADAVRAWNLANTTPTTDRLDVAASASTPIG